MTDYIRKRLYFMGYGLSQIANGVILVLSLGHWHLSLYQQFSMWWARRENAHYWRKNPLP